jgi:MPBQ/MSBQ methyltransferase
MLKWFRRGPSPYQTSLAMVGVKPGDRVLVAGSPEAELPAHLARLTGLNGQTLAANQSAESRAAIEAAARAEGALVDFAEAPRARLPADDGVVDIVVLAVQLSRTGDPEWRTLLTEGFRCLRPGGRLIVIDGVRRTSFFGSGSDSPPTSDAVKQEMVQAGGRAARTLASTEGLTYYEAQKPR